ncbi:hypothetical protein KI387_037547, partial [Taxus chinensis]
LIVAKGNEDHNVHEGHNTLEREGLMQEHTRFKNLIAPKGNEDCSVHEGHNTMEMDANGV